MSGGLMMSEDEGKLKLSVLFGSLHNLPHKRKNVVRIFLSSTFTDMTVERNMLMTSVFPKLKKYCQQVHHLEFQVVDMRWGVQDQAADDHSASELCMQGIINCQRESAGPTFVCFLGDRYGTRLLTKTISEEVWSVLVSYIKEAEVKKLLETWYKLDNNSAKPQRVLQPISYVENGAADWSRVSALMFDTLKDAAIAARDEGKITAEIAQEFIRSVTEEEIERSGILSDNADCKLTCLAFQRQINNINTQHVKAQRFIDLSGNNDIDAEKQGLLKKLKATVHEKLSEGNVKQYSVEWSENGGINADDHKEYLQTFCDDFYVEVKRLIDLRVCGQDLEAKAAYEDPTSREVLTHSIMAQDKLSKVVPRMDILDKIKSYITGDSDRPLVVHGHSGCGKTSVMASVAEKAPEWLNKMGRADKPIAVVLRFLGTTPTSSDIELLLANLNLQLRIFSEEDSDEQSSDTSLNGLISEFHRRIASFEKSQNQLVIAIDSIDQLRKNEIAYNLSWMPEKLPKNVKFVISTLPDIHDILTSAKLLRLPMKNFVEVKTLDETSAWTIIDKWLENNNRKLSVEQRAVVAKAFKKSSLPPLYIKLVFDILIKWTSYRQVTSIPTDVAACMDQLFNNLENTHGEIQVKLALGYLTCCPNGISETELEDVLSIDDDFLTSVFQYHIPPVRRIPPTLWVRMKSDISDYIADRESNGVAAMSWYHRQFREYAEKRYVANQQSTKHCLTMLDEYYAGKWSETPKPFNWTASQMKKLHIAESAASALRYVPAQPTRYSRLTFNARKINVLSQIWSLEWMKDLVYQKSARYLMDIEFLTGKFVHDTWKNIDAELSSLLGYMKEKEFTEKLPLYKQYQVEFSYVYAMLKMYSGLLSMSPYSIPAQLFTCLQDKYNLCPPVQLSETYLPNLAWFLQDLATGNGVDICPLLPVTKTLVSPGGMQVIVRQHNNLRKLFPFTYKGKSAVAQFSFEMVIHLIQDSGVIIEYATIPLSNYAPKFGHVVALANDENYLFCNSTARFCIISLENKREELDVSEIEVEPNDPNLILTSSVMSVFINPFIGGKDSIVVYSYEENLAIIYSVKLRKVVWYRHVSDKDNSIVYMSLHDTAKAHLKTLIVVLEGNTEVYQIKLLKGGGMNVTKKEVRPNGLANDRGGVVAKKVSFTAHGENQTNVIALTTPSAGKIIIADKAADEKNHWSCYEPAWNCRYQLAGKLRSGLDLLSIDIGTRIELYTIKDHDNIRHSATFPCPASPRFVYLVPHSDVLLVVVETTASLYFLTELEWPILEVTLAYELLLDNDGVEDLLADPRGFLVTTSGRETCIFWDLTAVDESENGFWKTNPQPYSMDVCKQIVCPLTMPTCALLLLDHGNLFNVSTNEYLGSLVVTENGDLPWSCSCFPGDNRHQLYVAILYPEVLFVFGVDFSSSESKHSMESKLIHKHQLEPVSTVCRHDKGIIALSNRTGVLYDFKIENMTEDMGKGFKLLSENGSHWENVEIRFAATECCYADNVLLVNGKERGAGSSRYVLIYDTTSYKFINKFEDVALHHTVYFQNFGLIICTLRGPGLKVFDTRTLEFTDILLKMEPVRPLTVPRNYWRDDEMYNAEKQPYFYCYSIQNGLLKMDITKYEQWSSGGGLTYLGEYNIGHGECRLSNGRKYIAAVTEGEKIIEVSKIMETKVELLGKFMFQDNVGKFAFSADDKYITAVLDSGEVICLKILDPADPSLSTEVNKLSCARNEVCLTQEELVKDVRWTTMRSLAESTSRTRTVDTLYEFMKNYVKPRDRPEENKTAYPLVGTEEFNQMFNEAVDKKTGKYTAIIHATPPDAHPVSKRQETMSKKVEERKSSQSIVNRENALKLLPPITKEPAQPPTIGSPLLTPKSTQLLPNPPSTTTRIGGSEMETEPELLMDAELSQDVPSERNKEPELVINDVNKKRTALCCVL